MLLVFELSFVKLLWPSREIFVMLSWSRFTCTPHNPLLCFFEKLTLYHPPIPQNKCSTVCVGLSLSFSLQLLLKKWGMGYQKKMDPWRSMKKRIKKRKRPIKVLKKKRETEREEEIVMLSKRFRERERERDHTKGVSIPSTIIHTRAHLDLIVWFVFLFGSGFLTLQYMWCKYAFSFIPTLKLHIWPSLEVGWKKRGKSNALVRTYTPWVIREYQMRS